MSYRRSGRHYPGYQARWRPGPGGYTTVLEASLAAFYEKVPIGHVEAGLPTYNFAAPWPEEMNRRLVDAISAWGFAPTETTRQNLLAGKTPG